MILVSKEMFSLIITHDEILKEKMGIKSRKLEKFLWKFRVYVL